MKVALTFLVLLFQISTDFAEAKDPPRGAGLTRDQAIKFIECIDPLFAQDIEARKVELVTGVDWAELTINGNTRFDGLYTTISLSKGAFGKKMDSDMSALMIAHEYGHILGKGPRSKFQNTTVEGEADYYAASIGMERIIESSCLSQSRNDSEEYRNAVIYLRNAGVTDSKLLEKKARIASASLRLLGLVNPEAKASFSERDESSVITTLDDYPSPQARLDTTTAALLGKPRPASWAVLKDF